MKSLKVKLYAIFLFLSILSLFIVFLSNYQQKEKEKLERTERLFTSVYISTLIKNNLIKDFIQNESKNIEFFETGKSDLLFKIDSINYTINYRLSKIEKSDETKTLGLSSVFIEMKNNIELQNSNYNYILRLIKKRGFADFGFIGAMRDESHTLEKQIQEYIALLLTIRRSEKDYMLRFDDKYIKKLKEESSVLSTLIKNNGNYSQAKKDSCLAYLVRYNSYFDSMVAINNTLGINQSVGLNHQMTALNQNIQFEFDKLIHFLRESKDQVGNKLTTSFISFSIFLILFSVFISFYLSNKISKPIILLSKQTKLFVQNKFEKSHELEIATNDLEIKNLVDNFSILENEIVDLLTDFKRKVAERTQTIEKQNEELVELNTTKDKFFSIIAHDLKGPFSTVIGFSEKLVKNYDKYDKDKVQKYLSNIQHVSIQTYKLLENLLEWARLQRGLIVPNLTSHNLRKVSDEVCSLSKDVASLKRIKIQNNTPKELMVNCDKELTKTIIRNLVSNAIKFTNELGVVSIQTTENDQFVTVEVKDTGIGMPQDRVDNLFRIEKNTSTVGTNNEQGTCLGLILCKELVEKQGGKIWVESKIGEGTSIFFDIPCAIN